MIIKDSFVNGVLKEIKPNIFAAIIEDNYERGMLFCRYQEFYESPIKEIRGKKISLAKMMNIYRKKNGVNMFSYPDDWAGYNIPSHVLYKAFYVLNVKEQCSKYNEYTTEYDKIMSDIIQWCEKKTKGDKFYLIGVNKKNQQLMNHEIAHGLYYTNIEYKKSVNKLILDIPKKEYNFVKNEIVKMGYLNQKKIIHDEMQAYLSTGLHDTFKTSSTISISKNFQKNFKSYV